MEEDTVNSFIKLFKNKVMMYKKKYKLESKMREKLSKQYILKTALRVKQEEKLQKKGKIPQKEFVFTLSKGDDCFFELMKLGTLAETNFEKWHNEEFIYPIGYKSRRVYIPYRNVDKAKMEYFCEITENGKIIRSEDGKIWSGPGLWREFVGCFSSMFEFKSLEHFFGLNYKPIIYKIEKLGNLSNFQDYVVFEERRSKNQ